MQTGWVKVSDTAGGSSDGEEGGSSASNPLADYRYYDKELGGKRASGWYVIEGVEGISEEGEEYYFYFKDGKPYYSEAEGLELFNINSERYALMKKERCRRDFRNSQLRTAQRPITTSATTVS